MSEYREGQVTVRGLRFHYLDWGDPAAPPIVLMHGTTSNAHSWDLLCPILAERYRCYAIDWLNHGDSETTETAGFWEQQMVDLAGLAGELGLAEFGLIGLSMGARASMAYAAGNPDRVNRLVLEDMAPHITAVGSQGARRFQRETSIEFDTWDDLVAWVRRARRFADHEWIEYTARQSCLALPDGHWTVKYQPRVAGNPADLDSAERLWAMLPAISCPTLLLRGGKSPILDDEITQRMVDTIPNCQAVVVPDAGHMIHEDNPAVALPLIAKFFAVSQ